MADLESLDLSLSEFLSLSLDLDEKMEGLEDLLGDSVAAVSAAADPPPDSIAAVEGSPSEVNNIFCAFCETAFGGKMRKDRELPVVEYVRLSLFFQPFCGNEHNWIFRNLEFREKILEFS